MDKPIRYDDASTEPLDVIRANECEARDSLATRRFRALWNEIERLRLSARNDYLIVGVEFGYKQCEKGNNIQAAIDNARKVVNG